MYEDYLKKIKEEQRRIDDVVEKIIELIIKKEIDLSNSDYLINQLKNKLNYLLKFY